MKRVKRKVFAYITHQQKLLIFSHPKAPEAGIQVPAGTIEEGETPEQAVLREAFEETGLTHLVLDGFLGEQERDMADLGAKRSIIDIFTISAIRSSRKQYGNIQNFSLLIPMSRIFSSSSGPPCLTRCQHDPAPRYV